MFSKLKTLVASLGKLFPGVASGKAAKLSRRRFMANRANLGLEALEDRLAPATWLGTSDQNWSTGANWDTGVAPGPNETAIFTAAHNNPSFVNPLFAGTVREVIINTDYTAEITLQRSLTVTVRTNQQDGIITGSWSWIVPTGGEYHWSGGTLRGTGAAAITDIRTGALMVISAPTATIDGRTLLNNGTIQWAGDPNATTIISFTNQGKIEQNSTFRITTEGRHDVVGSTGTFANGGLFEILANAQASFGGGLFPNSPTVTVSTNGVFSLLAANSGLLFEKVSFNGGKIAGPGTVVFTEIQVTGGEALVEASLMEAGFGSTISGTGTLRVKSQARLKGVGTINSAQVLIGSTGFMEITRSLTFTNSGKIVNEGNAFWYGGTIDIQSAGSAILNQGAGFLEISGGTENKTMTGAGAFSNNIGSRVRVFQGANTVTVGVTFTNSGNLELDSGTLKTPANWTQTGSIKFQGGNLQVPGTFTNGGTILVTEAGTIQTDLLQNNNVIDMVDQGSDTLTIARLPGMATGGNFTQGSTGSLRMEITGNAANDLLSIVGTATFGGALTVLLGNNYQPGGQNPRTWTLITYASRVNQFASHLLPENFNSYNYGPQSFTVTWTPPPP